MRNKLSHLSMVVLVMLRVANTTYLERRGCAEFCVDGPFA